MFDFLPKMPISKNLVLFFISLVIAIIIPGIGYLSGLDFEGRKTLFILSFAIGLWVTEAVPAFAVSLLIVGFQIFFLSGPDYFGNDIALLKYTQSWSSPIIWLLMGGFCLSLSFTLTGLDKIVAKVAIKKFGSTSYSFLLGMMASTAILSMFISNTASTALIIAILTPMLVSVSNHQSIKSCLLIGIPASASIGGMGTLIGSTPNAIAHSYLSNVGIKLEFLSWIKFGLPIAGILIFFVWLFLIFIFRPEKNMDQTHFFIASQDDLTPVIYRQRWIVIITFIFTLGLWIFAPFHNLSVSVISFIPMVVLSLTGVIKSADIQSLPWDTLLLIMGGMSLGDSVVESGLANFILSYFTVTSLSIGLTLVIFGYLSVLLSNFMSNTAAAAILIPMLSGLVPGKEFIICLTIALSASLATVMPVSTPPNAVSYSTGLCKSSDFVYTGLLLALIGPPLVVVILLFI